MAISLAGQESEAAAERAARAFIADFVTQGEFFPSNTPHGEISVLLKAPLLRGEVTLEKWIELLIQNHRPSAEKLQPLVRLLESVGRHAEARDILGALWRAGVNRVENLHLYLSAELRASGPGLVLRILGEILPVKASFLALAKEILAHPETSRRLDEASTALLVRLHAADQDAPAPMRKKLSALLGERAKSFTPADLALLAIETDQSLDGLAERIRGAEAPDNAALWSAARKLLGGVQKISASASPQVLQKAWRENADPLSRRLLTTAFRFHGVWPLEELFTSQLGTVATEAPPKTEGGLLIVSTGALPEAFLADLRGAQSRSLHLSMNPRHGEISMNDIMVAHNSSGDHEASHDAEAFGARMADAALQGVDPELRSIWALSLADRMFGHFKRARSFGEFLRREAHDQALVVLQRGDWLQMLAVGCVLSRSGVKVWATWGPLNPLGRRKILTALPWREVSTPFQALLPPAGGERRQDEKALHAWAEGALDRISAAQTPEPGPLGPFLNEAFLGRVEADFARGDRFLMMAGVGDPSYFAAAQALVGRMEERGEAVTLIDAGSAGKLPKAREGSMIPGAALEGAREGVAAVAAILEERMTEFCRRFDPAVVPVGAFLSFVGLKRVALTVIKDCASELIVARRLLEQGRPRKLITLPGRAPEIRGATILARRAGTPSVDLQAFYISAHPRYKPSLADAYCAITSDQASLYCNEIGPPEGQLVKIMGSLSMEQRLSSVRSLSGAEARRLLGMPLDARILLFGAQHGSGAEGQRILDLLIEMAAGWPENWRLAIKLHPRESLTAEEKLAEKIAASAGASRISLYRTQSIYEMIIAADVTATQFSNVGLEAAALGRPVLAINLTQQEYVIDLAEIGVAERVSSPEELRERARFWMTAPVDQDRLSPRARAYLDRNPLIGANGTADAILNLLKGEIRIQEGIRPRLADQGEDHLFRKLESAPSEAAEPAAAPFRTMALQLPDADYDTLLEKAAEFRKQRDIGSSIDLLLRAHDLQPSPKLAGRIGAEALLISDLELARRMFGVQGLTTSGAHKLGSHVDLLRCALIEGQEDEVVRLRESMPVNWRKSEARALSLFTTGIKVERLHWIVDLLVDYLNQADLHKALPELQDTLFALASPAQTKALTQALSSLEGTPASLVLLAWFKLGEKRQGEAIALLQQVAEKEPSLLDLIPSLSSALPVTLDHLDDDAPMKEKIEAFTSIKGKHCCAVLCSGVALSEVQSLLSEAEVVDVLPLSDLLASQTQVEALTKAVASLGRDSSFRIVNPLLDYGEQNTPLASRLSDAADLLAEDLEAGIAAISDEEIRSFMKERQEALSLQISSSFFGILRQRAALISYLREHQPQNIVIYANSTRTLQELVQVFSWIKPEPRIFVVNVSSRSNPQAWRQALSDLRRGSAAPRAEPQADADVAAFIRRIEPGWTEARTQAEAWSEDVVRRFQASEKPPLLIASVNDRIYGPTIRTLKNVLKEDFSLFSIVVGYSGMGLQGSQENAVPSEGLLEYPAAPFTPFELQVARAQISSWLSRWSKVEEVLKDCAMSREFFTEEVARWLPSFLRYTVSRNLLLAHGLKGLFKTSPPALLLAQPTRNIPNRIIAQTAQDCGVKVVEAMSVYMSRMPRYRRPAADLVLAIDTFSEDLLTGHFGMSPDQVRIIGSLRFEEGRQRLAQIPTNPFVKPGEKTIMVVTQNTVLDSNLAILWQSLNLLRKMKLPEMRLVVKMHPVEPEHHGLAYAQEINRFKLQSQVRVTRNDDPYLLAQASTLVVSKFSNLILEAAALGVPGLVLAEKNSPLPVPFDKMGVAIIAEPGAPFLNAARDLIQRGPRSAKLERKRRAFFERNPLMTHFGSAEAAHDVILEMIGKPGRSGAHPHAASRSKSFAGWLSRLFRTTAFGAKLKARRDRAVRWRE
ncbi:hypothetical protein [Neomegalonema sp.]|uniref:hypothetical protein n=1 Tax=Neomegalonema sp. TaxID=2039713 RepID=UPI00261B5051|nr:hypothetical protein [Neomegalonema sp.]MDD2869325.1 hypothetical protein [Neomegalonema sp.]